MAPFSARLAAVRDAVAAIGAGAILVTKNENLAYLFGFTGSAGLGLVLPDSASFITDPRYTLQAERELAPLVESESDDVNVIIGGRVEHLDHVRRALAGTSTLALEADSVSLARYRELAHAFPDVTLVDSTQLIERVRLVKDDGELALLRSAAAIADAALADTVHLLGTGITERQFAIELEHTMSTLGSDERSFATMVSSGPNSAAAHLSPSDRVIGDGDAVIIDFGATVGGYHSDMTRTVLVGTVSSELHAIYDAVEASAHEALRAAVPGATHGDIYRAADLELQRHGLTDAIVHPVGHNVGLEIHELPYLSRDQADVLVAGQVLAVEPGVYQPGVGGVRIENMIVVGTGEILTNADWTMRA